MFKDSWYEFKTSSVLTKVLVTYIVVCILHAVVTIVKVIFGGE